MHFNASVTFLLLVLKILKMYHKGDLAGHCPIYSYSGRYRVVAQNLCDG